MAQNTWNGLTDSIGLEDMLATNRQYKFDIYMSYIISVMMVITDILLELFQAEYK